MKRVTTIRQHQTCQFETLEHRQLMSAAGTYLGSHNAPNNGVLVNDVAATRGGMVIAVGRQGNEAVVERYSKGSTAADNLFGGGGIRNLNLKGNNAYATALNVVIQPDDRILVSGLIQQSNSQDNQQWFVARLTDKGALDSSFGTNGVAYISGMHVHSRPRAIVQQADGKVLVTGSWRVSTNYRDFVTARLTTAGKLDTAFGDKAGVLQAGYVVTSLASNDDAQDVAVQSDGKIVIVGSSVYGHSRPAAVRYTTVGKLDTTFDGDGKLLTDELNSAGYRSVAVDGNSLYFAGSLQSVSSPVLEDALLLRKYNSAGKLDTTFGKSGTVTFKPNNSLSYYANNVYVPKTGKIFVAGSIDDSTSANTKLISLMFNSNGSKDTSFGAGSGSVTIPGTQTHPSFTQTAVTPQGTILYVSGNNISEISEAQVTVFATNGSVGAEGGSAAYFDLVRDGNYNFPTQVNFKVTGSAKAGGDYSSILSTGYAIIPAGTSTLRIYAFATDDADRESTESIIVTFNGPSYLKFANTGTSMLISDNDFATSGLSIASSLFSDDLLN